MKPKQNRRSYFGTKSRDSLIGNNHFRVYQNRLIKTRAKKFAAEAAAVAARKAAAMAVPRRW